LVTFGAARQISEGHREPARHLDAARRTAAVCTCGVLACLVRREQLHHTVKLALCQAEEALEEALALHDGLGAELGPREGREAWRLRATAALARLQTL